MEFELRVVVEKVDISTQAVVKRDTLKVYDVTPPKSILDLGLRHAEQISLLEKVQSSLLAEQSNLIVADEKVCPNCGHKLSRNGYTHSQFHAVFSDHRLCLQKHRCPNRECSWQRVPTITSVFGTSIHPDLAKLQCEQGALFSYREAQSNLAKLNTWHRSVNNHSQINRLTDRVGAILAEQNRTPPSEEAWIEPAPELILQVDGGHIPTRNKAQRSLEALSAIVYRPESVQQVDQFHREIKDKTCVISAMDDELKTMKTYLLNGTHQQGMNQNTKVTALADGATNCWRVISSLKPHCNQLECILDWFPIAKKFQTVKQGLAETFCESLDKAKWTLWHGDGAGAIWKLELLLRNVTDPHKRSKLKGLYEYLQRNQSYLANYAARKQTHQPYTTQVAESQIECVINARHKKSGKMQWTREGAHHVLQIRATLTNKEWTTKWQGVVLSALLAAA